MESARADKGSKREGQKEPPELTFRVKIGFPLFSATIFFLFAFFSQPSRGVVAAGSFGCIAVLVLVKWELRGVRWFQAFIAAAVLIHAIAVWAYDGTIDFHPTILIAPLF